MTQRFLPRFTCLPATYALIVMVTHLEVHALIGIQKPNPQRVLLNQHKMKKLNVTSNVLEWLLALRRGIKPENPSQRTMGVAKNNHQSCQQSSVSPSHLGGGNHQE